jgi:molybdenum cofactor cytidylyltransferase
MAGPPDLRIFDVIVLAAGASTRFGADNKLTQPYRGRPLAGHILDLVSQLDCARRILVTGGPYRREMQALLQTQRGWCEAYNPDAETGMGGSIAAGAALLSGSAGVFIVPADMPNLVAGDFIALAEAFVDEMSICRPVFEGQPGHPVLFGAAHHGALRQLKGTRGAARLLSSGQASLTTVRSSNAGVVRDFDMRSAFEDRP